jgi:dienelactone hydrolase
MFRPCFAALLAVFCLALAQPAEARRVGGVVVPDRFDIQSADRVKPDQARFLGIWAGAWGGTLRHIMIVTDIAANGEVEAIYSWGDSREQGIAAGTARLKGRIDGNSLRLKSTFEATYTIGSDETLDARWARGDARSMALLRKVTIEEYQKPEPRIGWPPQPRSEMLRTTLDENGRAIALEVLFYRPEGKGPFPLVVFNHGSTGRGNDPAAQRRSVGAPYVADFFTARGFIVAVPQRRGRGKSDGFYDEGFTKDRSRYSCEPRESLPGVDRAIADIEAAVAAMRGLPDVAPGAFLIGGQSRGGILALVYAGTNPGQVRGVVNFVGGWLGQSCPRMQDAHATLLRRAAPYTGETLWLYGEKDPFYTVQQSRRAHEAFTKAGGKGDFRTFEVSDGDGHGLLNWPRLWGSAVEGYLARLPK